MKSGSNGEGARKGGVVATVDSQSLGSDMGLLPGDVVLEVNGHPLRDVIDFRYFSSDPEIELSVCRGDEMVTLHADREYGQALGVEFEHPTFDVDIRRCHNQCDFCFVTQSPPKMRRTLYIKDDDYRYSFLFGHYVTLTNLRAEDWQRIEDQHLSPLHVSVHATQLGLRRTLLGNENTPDVLEQIRWLGERLIRVHTQLVLIPGLNDAEYLERSLADLTALYPTVQSISVVPIGLTRFHSKGMRSYTANEARQLLDQVQPWREHCRQTLGITMVYPSDEWYLSSGRTVPPDAEYDGFGQIDNGVGMVRQIRDEWELVKHKLVADQSIHVSSSRNVRATLVCGELAEPVLHQIMTELKTLTGIEVQVQAVVNNWYGRTVTVSGLLAGRDVVSQLSKLAPQPDWSADSHRLGDLVFLPRVMLDNSGQVTLDDMTPLDLSRQLGVPVVIAQELDHVIEALGSYQSAGISDEAHASVAAKSGWWGGKDRPFWHPTGSGG